MTIRARSDSDLNSLCASHGRLKKSNQQWPLQGHEGKQSECAYRIARPKVAIGNAKDIAEEKMLEAHLHAGVFDERDAESEGKNVEGGHGRFVLDARAAGDEMAAQCHEDCGEKPPEQQPAGFNPTSIAANARPGSIEWERASATRARRRSTT